MDFFLTRIFRWTAAFVVVIAGMSWWLTPVPQAVVETRSSVDTWNLPASARGNPEKAVASITQANLWGTVATATQAPLNEPEWRFAGVAVNGSEKTVIISAENQPLQMLRIGDQLPGGAKILRINEDHLCLSINGKKRKLDLFQ